ncbi:outer membrane beta-barrel protein [Salinimonas sediminis]|nr:outer membrane beta-barrel protein [Salinimonas sediminis]
MSMLLAGCLCSAAQATEKMYGVVGAGYSDAEFSNSRAGSDLGSETFYLALGHEFAPQWYIEGGYKRLFDDSDETGNTKGDALYLAVLGKAGGPQGELFYKLGVMSADISGQYLMDETDNCEVGQVIQGACDYDEGVVAGLVGLGYDYHLGLNTMIRIEYEHVRGEHNLSANLFNLGFRYNFN